MLIVEDEPSIVAALEYLARHAGYEVRSATDGEQALEQVAAFAPDLVLLDVMMPRQSGYEVCRRIRSRPEWSGIRIAMLSARGREAEVSKGLSLGADLYITKPFSNAELMARLKQLLGEDRAPGGTG